jgi:eukaryotic-like serine/threonine-protein kinase
MEKPLYSPTLEQVIARYVEAIESGQPLDKAQLLGQYRHLQPELGEFLEGNEQFLAAAQSVREQLSNAASSQSSSAEALAQQRLEDRLEIFAPSRGSSLAVSPPRQLGDYTIESEIARGGMGVVYKAHHIHLGRTVALKVIRSGELASEQEVLRFRIEAEAAAALTHPGIVPIYEVGRLNELVFYTMAYIDGQSLESLARRGPMDNNEAARIVQELCLAVEYAHQRGVLHRDLKPANVLIDKHGHPVIIDFGLAKQSHHDSGLTVSGQILGTPAFMAPEQALGRTNNGPAADVYSLGAILYTLLAGQSPFSGPTPFDVLLQVLDRDPPVPSQLNRRVTRELNYICRKSMAKDAADRYPSAAAMAEDLQRVLVGQPIDCPVSKLGERFDAWWRREPILVAHVFGIGITTAIVVMAYWIRGQTSMEFPLRLLLLTLWFGTAFLLQALVVRARWRDTACMTWASVDVVLYTALIAFAAPPIGLLLIGYPMMIVASSLFYRVSFVIYTTVLCIIGFMFLVWLQVSDVAKLDFCAIFVSGLVVICITLLAMIRRVRGMAAYSD